MSRNRQNTSILTAIAATFLLSTCTHTAPKDTAKKERSGLFPEDVKGMVWYNKALKFREPRLYRDGDLDGFTSRYRLSISGITCTTYVIRIDETSSGRLTGMVRHHDRCKKGSVESHRLHPSRAKFDEIKGMIEKAGMFTHYPETWELDDKDTICIDGHQLLFERRDARGYGISESNAQCTSPPKVREIAKKFIAMSGEEVGVIL